MDINIFRPPTFVPRTGCQLHQTRTNSTSHSKGNIPLSYKYYYPLFWTEFVNEWIYYYSHGLNLNFPQEWSDTLKTIASSNKWTNEVSMQVLKLITADRVHGIFLKCKSLEESLDCLSNPAFSREDYTVYVSLISYLSLSPFEFRLLI